MGISSGKGWTQPWPENRQNYHQSMSIKMTEKLSYLLFEFHRWFNSVYTEPVQSEVEQNSDYWIRDRLEYKFAVSAPSFDDEGKETALVASEYSEGSLDLYSFSVDTKASSLGYEPNAGRRIDKQVAAFLPANATFDGMPNKRWWDFEDETYLY
jgi:hypothetical protein